LGLRRSIASYARVRASATVGAVAVTVRTRPPGVDTRSPVLVDVPQNATAPSGKSKVAGSPSSAVFSYG